MDGPKKIKRKQATILLIGLASFTSILIFGMWISDPNRGKPSALELRKLKAQEMVKNYRTNSSLSTEESWVAQSERELKTVKEINEKLTRQMLNLERKIESLQKDRSADQNRGSKNNHRLPPQSLSRHSKKATSFPPAIKPEETELPRFLDTNSIFPNNEEGKDDRGRENRKKKQKKTAADDIQVITLTNPKKEEKQKNMTHYIPAGSFATAVIMSGLDAPTGGLAKTQPMPVLIRIKHPGQLPNYFHSKITDCHITGAGYGDLAAERAYIRLEMLSCVLVNGDIVEVPVSGYLTGEDGKAGLRGRVVGKQGSLLAKAALAGIFSGIGNAVAQTHQSISQTALGNVTTYDSKKIGQAGLALGTSTAMNRIADFYIARANETYPVIEIDAHRIGEVIFTKGIELGLDFLGKSLGSN